MHKELRIGIIGLDTSHVTAFTELLNDNKNAYYVPGGKVTMAYPGGSPDFDLSINRVAGFTQTLKETHHVQIVDKISTVAEQCDAILLESVDGRVHLEQFRQLAPYGKPVFIDKPLTIDVGEAEDIQNLAEKYKVPIMTASSLRFAAGLDREMSDEENGKIVGADAFGPMAFLPTQTGYFWYGIHSVEMLYRALGSGCKEVQTFSNELHDVIVGQWEDGRIGTVRGHRLDSGQFDLTLHRERGSSFTNIAGSSKPFYACLMEQVMRFFQTGLSPVSMAESVEVIKFIHAANESRLSGLPVSL